MATRQAAVGIVCMEEKSRIMNHRVTTKESILDVATDIALREGIDSLSVRKVANACGIAVGSVYNYCKNKEELSLAVTERFWSRVFADHEQLSVMGMGFTDFLERYYSMLYGRLRGYDASWLRELSMEVPSRTAVPVMKHVLLEDGRVNRAIWNMELNEDVFCEYVFVNMMALLRSGEDNCRFFIYLLEHLLYARTI